MTSRDDQGKGLLRELGKALVCISGRFALFNPATGAEEQEQVFSCTAFAMSFSNVPILVTAGHVIQDTLDPLLLNKLYQGYPVRVAESNLCDFFGPNTKVKKPSPFDYCSTRRVAIDQSLNRQSDGLDFGLIMLREFYWSGMLANGVEPIPQERWVNDQNEQFDVYKMIGFPEDAALARQGLSRPTLYTVTKSTDTGVATPNGQPAWFVGQLPAGIKSVSGLSGGPIFGFRKLGENLWDYRVVAMQSWGDPNSGTIYATPLRSFATMVDDAIRRLGQQLTQEGQEADPSPLPEP